MLEIMRNLALCHLWKESERISRDVVKIEDEFQSVMTVLDFLISRTPWFLRILW